MRSGCVLVASAAVPVALLGLTHLDVSRPADGKAIDPGDPAQVAGGENIYDATGHAWQADRLRFDYAKRSGAAVLGGEFRGSIPALGGRLAEASATRVLRNEQPAEGER